MKDMHMHTFFKFCTVGGLGVVTNLLVFTCVLRIGFSPQIAATLAFALAVTQNYVLNNGWSFRSRTSGIRSLKEYVRYVGVNIAGLCINLVILSLVLRFTSLSPVVAQIIGVAASTLWNYVGAHSVVFRKISP